MENHSNVFKYLKLFGIYKHHKYDLVYKIPHLTNFLSYHFKYPYAVYSYVEYRVFENRHRHDCNFLQCSKYIILKLKHESII